MSTRSSVASRSSTRTRWFPSKWLPISRPSALAFVLFVCGGTAPAFATGSIVCEGQGADGARVTLNMLIGHLPVLKVLDANFEVGEDAWSTAPDRMPGQPIAVGQAFGDDRQILVDFTDPNIESVLASLRLIVGGAPDHPQSGILTVPGVGAWAVTCGEG